MTETFICLLRGINVGGHHKVKMAELRDRLGRAGFDGVRTYIQSGNIAFEATGPAKPLAQRVEDLFAREYDFTPRALVFAATPTAEAAAVLAAFDGGADRFVLSDRVLYLHTPNGYGRSKLAVAVERLLKVPATARNWRSVLKILDLAQQPAD